MDVETLYSEAQEAFSIGDMDAAGDCLEKMMGIDAQAPKTIELQGDFARIRGELKKARKLYSKLESMADSPQSRGEALLNLGFIDLDEDQDEQGRQRFAEAAKLFEETGEVYQQITALVNEAGCAVNAGDLHGGLDAIERCRELARAQDDPEEFDQAEADLAFRAGHIYRMLGELAKAETALKEAISRFADLDDDIERASALDALGIVYQVRGEYDEAERLHLEALALNEEWDYDSGKSINYGNLTMLNLHRKNLDEAERYAKQAYEIDLAEENENGIAYYHLLMGDIEQDRENLTQSEAYYLKALKLYKGCGDAEDFACCYSKLGVVYRLQGKLAESEKMCRQGLEIAEEMDHRDGIASVLDELAHIRRDQGKPEEARDYWEQSLKIFRELDSKRMIADIEANLVGLDS